MKKKIKNEIKVHCNHDAMVNVSDLVPNPNNPNWHPDEQIELLSKMIQGNGWRDRITVSNRSGMIVKGHGRYLAAIQAGLAKVPVEYQDYGTEAEEITDLIGDNKISELSIVDEEAARNLIDGIGVDFDMHLAGFDIVVIDGDIGNKDTAETAEIEFSQEILLEHNYVVLYFDNPFDWKVAIDKFQLKRVKDLIPRKGQPVGIGRVLSGMEWLDRIN